MSLDSNLHGPVSEGEVIDPSRWWGVQLRYLTLIPLFLLTFILDQFGVIEIPSVLYLLFTAAVGFALFLHGACYVGWWPQKLTLVAITLDSLMIALACVLTGGSRSPFLLVFVVQALGISLMDNTLHASYASVLAIFVFLILHYGAPTLEFSFIGTGDSGGLPTMSYITALLLVVIVTGTLFKNRILNRERALRQGGDELKEAYHQLKSSYERLAEASASLANSEKVLEQTEKLSSLGRMAAGVAHELNNPLTMISNYVQMSILQGEKGGVNPELMDRLQKILMGVERITELSRNLTSFARSSPVGKSQIDLNQVLKEALSFTEFEIRRAGITIQTDLSSNLPKIYGTKGALSQVAVNLFLNAKDAISPKKKGEISIRSFQTESGEVAFQVKDSGCGIPREILSKIFDPFFTTKEEGKGTGLGLAIAIKIVNEHGGRIQVESEPREWTQFTVYLLPSPIELKKEVA
jgi:signal transduction histidine kinase